ncbi:type IV pilus biogenesis/stability protein PilW [Lysobacter fragariae]
MRQRDVLMLGLLFVATAATVGCRHDPYVSTSLENQRGFIRTAPDVTASETKRNFNQDSRRVLQLAEEELSAGNLPEAKKFALSALKQDPKSADAHTMMAVVLANSGDTAGAGKYYRQAAELAPTNPGIVANYATWLCSQGQAAQSLPIFDRALSMPNNPSPAGALANMGACADQAGQGDRADLSLRQAIALDPDNAVALGTLAQREFRAGNAFEARAFSERRLAAAPADPQSLLLASQIEEKLGDRTAAAKYVARLKTEFPDASEARNSATGDGGRQ